MGIQKEKSIMFFIHTPIYISSLETRFRQQKKIHWWRKTPHLMKNNFRLSLPGIYLDHCCFDYKQ